ncbi:MAG TPA: polysaccharide deacetylase [Vicinamibacteria bacterium]|nr:polysaccharide deacetylase [Vicinamibacteria bacterium]
MFKGYCKTKSLMFARRAASTAVLVFACCAPPPPDPVVAEPEPGWLWTTEKIDETVNQVRAGRNLQPERWPHGARVAVLLSFDVDNETIALRYGEPTIGALSQGEYGARVGLKRVVELLDAREIPASFFIPSESVRLNPSMADVIKRSGRHEIAVHGWIHELNSSLPADLERELVERAADYLTEIAGERPVGYRAPSWNFSDNTLDIIRELGFLYDSSLMADDRPYELLADGEPTGIIELPVEWILDDAPLMNPSGARYSSPRDVLRVYIDEFDMAYDEGTMFLLTMHPHYIGHRSRIVILKELIDYVQSKEEVWWATHRQVAEYVREQAGLAPATPSQDAP